MRQKKHQPSDSKAYNGGLKKEMGAGEANLELLDRLVGSIPAGGDAVEDAREAF